MGSFHQITYNLIIEVFNVGPLDAFPVVFFLLLLEYQLNKQLLKLLVTIVDAELFEAVVVEYFKTIDIQDLFLE